MKWIKKNSYSNGFVIGIILGFGIYPSLLIRQFVNQGEINFDVWWPLCIIVICALGGILIEYVVKKFKSDNSKN